MLLARNMFGVLAYLPVGKCRGWYVAFMSYFARL